MISGKSILCYPYKSEDLVTKIIRKPKNGIMEDFAALIASGYTIYDVSAESGFCEPTDQDAGKIPLRLENRISFRDIYDVRRLCPRFRRFASHRCCRDGR